MSANNSFFITGHSPNNLVGVVESHGDLQKFNLRWIYQSAMERARVPGLAATFQWRLENIREPGDFYGFYIYFYPHQGGEPVAHPLQWNITIARDIYGLHPAATIFMTGLISQV